jgi:glycosyltransferase involved in cell wall biosynthesis
MRVLVAALACAPVGSSEEFLGWQAVRAISRYHEVWVLTIDRNRESITCAQASGAAEKVHFEYLQGFNRWVRNPTLFRLQGWLEFMEWSRKALRAARALHQRHRFHLAHHITYSAWRVPSLLWRLNIPLVWGPIGGGGDVPLHVLRSMSWPGMTLEGLRKVSQLARYLPGPRRCAREAACVIASNSETAELIRRLRGSSRGLFVMWPTYFSDTQIARYTARERSYLVDGTLRIFAGGTAIGSKGLALALRGLRCALDRGVRFVYTIASQGPECVYLRRMTRDLGLEQSVRFVTEYRGSAYASELQASHCFLVPSFRENLGVTMIEAMLTGAVPIVADISAPGEVVTPMCGIKIPVTSTAEMVQAIGDAVQLLARNPRQMFELGVNASARARQIVNQNDYEENVEAAYQIALTAQRDHLVIAATANDPSPAYVRSGNARPAQSDGSQNFSSTS